MRGLYQGGDVAMSRDKPGRPMRHVLTRHVPITQCATCHNGGGRAAMNSTFLAPGSNTTLSFAVAGSVAPGIYPVTVTGQANVDGQTLTRTAAVSLEVLAPGTTAAPAGS